MGFLEAAALNKEIIGLIREALTRTNREDPRGLWVNSLEEREVLSAVCVWAGGARQSWRWINLLCAPGGAITHV